MDKFSAPFTLAEVQPEEGTFEGTAAVYGKEFETMFGSLIIEPGAFTESIKQDADRFPILWQHNELQPIGKPLELSDEKDGLHIRGKISDTTTGRDALTLLRDGVVKEMSIGLDRIEETRVKDETPRLKKGKLWEFSLVTFGAAGRQGARIHEVHKAAELPLEVQQAIGYAAELELKYGPLAEMIPVSKIEELCAPAGEKLRALGFEAVSVEQFLNAIDSLKEN